MLDRVVGVALQIALVPILASTWGLERYGVWGMLIAFPGILILSDLGFTTAATVRMTMQIARGDLAAARITIHSASQVVLAAGALLLGAGWAAAAFLPDRLFQALSLIDPTEVRGAILCLSAYSALIIGHGLLQAVFRSNQRFAFGSLVSTATLLLENALLVAAVSTGGSILLGAGALLVGRTSGTIIAIAAAVRLCSGPFPGLRMADRQACRELLGPALAAMAIPLGLTLIGQGQVIVLAIAAGAMAVPAFVASRTLSRLALQLAQALAHPLMPEFASAVARHNRLASVRYFALVLAGSGALSLGWAILLAVAGPWIITAWSGGHIAVPSQLMLIMAVSALAGGIWNPVSNLILAVNEHARFAPALLGLALAGLLLTLATGACWGSSAAALSMAAIDLVMVAIVLRFALSRWGSPTELLRILVAMASQAKQEATQQLRD